MSLDRSLKISASLSGKRSVMTRAERIQKLLGEKKYDVSKDKALGLAKTLVPTK
jgi:small basic protein (TIGR04137 family)